MNSVEVQYPDEQGPDEEVGHCIGDTGIDGGSIEDVRVSANKRFVFVKMTKMAHVSGGGGRRPFKEIDVYDLERRKHLESIALESD